MNVLLIVYKIEADKGSEDGSGYHMAAHIAQKVTNLTILTRINNIEKLKSDPNFSQVTLIGLDVPKAIGFFKKKSRGIVLYYYLWQIFAGFKASSLQKTQKYDVIHQWNFHAAWAAHFLFGRRSRLVWGPLVQHALIPRDFWFGSLWRYYCQEYPKQIVKAIFRWLDPFLWWAVWRTDVIFFGQRRILAPYRFFPGKIRFLPFAGSSFMPQSIQKENKIFHVLFIGRFVDLKGCVAAIQAFATWVQTLPSERRNKIKMTLVGDGERATEIHAQAQITTSGTEIAIDILPWQPQKSLARLYQDASVFLFPSFEGQGMVVAEALSFGCPVICFTQSGPEDVAGQHAIALPAHDYRSTIRSLADLLDDLAHEFWYHPDQYAARRQKALMRAQELSWDKKAQEIIQAYHG